MMNGGQLTGAANPDNSDALYVGDLQWVRLSFASSLSLEYLSKFYPCCSLLLTVDNRRRFTTSRPEFGRKS